MGHQGKGLVCWSGGLRVGKGLVRWSEGLRLTPGSHAKAEGEHKLFRVVLQHARGYHSVRPPPTQMQQNSDWNNLAKYLGKT